VTADSLRGRTALVTGGSRGIGAAISIALAEAGPAVAINYRERTHEANKLAEDLRKAGVRVTTVQADVSPAEVVSKMVDSAKSELGTIGILINAGIAITRGMTIFPKPTSIEFGEEAGTQIDRRGVAP